MTTRKYLTFDEIERMLEAALKGSDPERDYCLIWMCFIHGCRVSEINSWCLSDINLSSRSIYIRRLKNGLSTIHPLFEIEHQALTRWLNVRARHRYADQEWVFLSRKGNRLSRQQIYTIVRDCSERAGLGFSAHPHMLRHSCGYALADRGMDTRLIQDYLGHKNIQHTVLYTASNAQRFIRAW